MNVTVHDADQVVDEASFAHFLLLLSQDRKEVETQGPIAPRGTIVPDAHGWYNTHLGDFFEAANACWTGNVNAHGSFPVNPWTRAAHILLCGKIYE